MGSRRGLAVLPFGGGLIACGAVGATAFAYGVWGLFTGAVLVAAWLLALGWWATALDGLAPHTVRSADGTEEASVLRVLLDSAPTPLLSVDAGAVRALNRAARTMFATDDRVLPLPAALLDRGATHLRHEGCSWRIDRVDVAGAGRMVVALIDIEQEERTAEARANAELIQVLGHELLNGLAPIVSLAESGLAAVAMRDPHSALLPEILGTLARRAEGLQRFTEVYRTLARLPEPTLRPVSVAALVEDLVRSFESRWPAVTLEVAVAEDLTVILDHDQISQALWAILQNAAEAAALGNGALRVSLTAQRDGTGAILEVSDSGPGIQPSDAHRIFRPFHTTKPDGTGIGLSLARQIAHAHGGMLLLLQSRPTTFVIRLPANDATDDCRSVEHTE